MSCRRLAAPGSSWKMPSGSAWGVRGPFDIDDERTSIALSAPSATSAIDKSEQSSPSDGPDDLHRRRISASLSVRYVGRRDPTGRRADLRCRTRRRLGWSGRRRSPGPVQVVDGAEDGRSPCHLAPPEPQPVARRDDEVDRRGRVAEQAVEARVRCDGTTPSQAPPAVRRALAYASRLAGAASSRHRRVDDHPPSSLQAPADRLGAQPRRSRTGAASATHVFGGNHASRSRDVGIGVAPIARAGGTWHGVEPGRCSACRAGLSTGCPHPGDE